MGNKFYTADGTEYAKVFENEAVVLGRDQNGEYKIMRHEETFAGCPNFESSENPETKEI